MVGIHPTLPVRALSMNGLNNKMQAVVLGSQLSGNLKQAQFKSQDGRTDRRIDRQRFLKIRLKTRIDLTVCCK